MGLVFILFLVLGTGAAAGGALSYYVPRHWPIFIQPPSPVDNVGRFLLICLAFAAGGIASFFTVGMVFNVFNIGSGSYEDVLPALFIAMPLMGAFFAGQAERLFRYLHNKRTSARIAAAQ